jgi:hypothetical protein
MSRIMRRRPSPAMVVALIALCVALGGTATALPGRNTVRKDDIARAAVRAQHIYSKAVRTKHIRARNVTRSKIARRAINSDLVGLDALTGSNIVESSLSTVPNASNASKVNNRSVEKFSFVAPAGTAAVQVLSLNGISVFAACGAGPALDVTAATSVSGSWVHSGGTHGGAGNFYVADDAFNAGDTFAPLQNATTGSTNLRGTLTYVRPDGEVTTADFLAQETATSCVFAGSAIG